MKLDIIIYLAISNIHKKSSLPYQTKPKITDKV